MIPSPKSFVFSHPHYSFKNLVPTPAGFSRDPIPSPIDREKRGNYLMPILCYFRFRLLLIFYRVNIKK